LPQSQSSIRTVSTNSVYQSFQALDGNCKSVQKVAVSQTDAFKMPYKS